MPYSITIKIIMTKLEKNTLSINGKAYDWTSVNVAIGTSLFYGITNITFSEKQDVKPIYNDGIFPIGYGYGKISVGISITIEMEELRILLMASNEESIYNLPPLPLTIAFIDDFDDMNTIPFTYIINNVKFTSSSSNMSQNSSNTYVTLTGIASNVIKIPTDRLKLKPLEIVNQLIDIHKRGLSPETILNGSFIKQ